MRTPFSSSPGAASGHSPLATTTRFALVCMLYCLGSAVCFSASSQGRSNTPRNGVPHQKAERGLIRDMQVPIKVSQLTYLGNKLLDSIPGLYTDAQHKSEIAANFQSQKTPYNTYLYNNLFVIQTTAPAKADLSTLNTAPSQDWELYYTVRALQLLQTKYPQAYTALLVKSMHPDQRALNQLHFQPYVNKFSKVVISFTDAYGGIAISGTQLGATNDVITNQQTKYTVYNNLPIISISPTLIRGTTADQGSYPIYRRESADENFHLYMKEGLLHTLVHELTHRVTDVRNNDKRTVYNFIYYGPGRQCKIAPGYICPLYDMEEIVVGNTINQYFRRVGGLSPELLTFYDNTAASLKNKIGADYLTYTNQMTSKTGFTPTTGTYTLLD
jgi:hypothetical protein